LKEKDDTGPPKHPPNLRGEEEGGEGVGHGEAKG